MTEPYVPSGKEYDEGLPRRAPRTRVGRAISKVTRRRRGPSRVHELRTHVSDEVGEGRKSELKTGRRREILHQDGGTVAVPTGGTTKAAASPSSRIEGDEGSRSGPSAVPASATKPVVSAPLSTAPLDPDLNRDLLVVVCGSGDLQRQSVVDLLKASASDPSLGTMAREAVEFLVAHAEGQTAWTSQALPDDVQAVLAHALSVGLEEYGALLQKRDRVEAALRELEANQHAYPVLGRIVQLCRSGKATKANVRMIVGDWNAPVYVIHQHAINTAIDACTNAGAGTMRAPILDRARARFPESDRDVVHACLSRVSTSPVYQRDVTTARARLGTAARSNAALRKRARDLGVLMKQELTPRTGRKKVNVRVKGPAAAPATSTAPARSVGPKCRKCGVLPADRHGMCSGCSSYGD